LPYDPVRDFVPVTMVCTSPLYLAAHASLPVRSVQELVAYARSRPGASQAAAPALAQVRARRVAAAPGSVLP
ncbi:MAG: tripartite tricarboxylate transporter substrate-binding protein, partial [Spirochaetia bacterium]